MKTTLHNIMFQYLIPLTFVILWSVGSIFNKIGLSYTTPFAFLFYRLVIASFFLIVLAYFTKSPWPKTRTSFINIVLTGLVLQFGYLTLFYYTLYNNISPAIVTTILGLQPIFTVAIIEFILKKNISVFQWIGSILGLAGVYLLVSKDLSYGNMTFTGLFYSVTCLLTITVGTLMQKNNSDMNLVTGTAIQLTVSIIPASIFNIFLGSFIIPLNPMFIFSLVWVALIVSVGAICIYYALLKRSDVVKTTNLFYLVPPFTAVLCYFFLDEQLHSYLVVSIILIVAGMIIAEKRKEDFKRKDTLLGCSDSVPRSDPQ